MHKGTLKADALLLLTAVIWGFAFVAQRVGMEHLGPFAFNGIRFALGSLSLLPLIAVTRRRRGRLTGARPRPSTGLMLGGGALAGAVLFAGASLQQVGIVSTTAGNAGFITGLYVVLVPMLGIRLGHRTSAATWGGALLAAAGLYLLSVTQGFTIHRGDLLVLVGAFFWALHVLLLAWLAPRMDALWLAASQFAATSVLSLAAALLLEEITLAGVRGAALPIIYGGLFSVGIAYTLQVVAQREAPPAHAAVILSLEGAFAALGGWLLIGEVLSLRGLTGCALMLAGMLLSQLDTFRPSRRPAAT